MAKVIPVDAETLKSILNLENVKRESLFTFHEGGVLLYLKKRVGVEHFEAATIEGTEIDKDSETAFMLAYSFLMLQSTIEFLNLNTLGDGIIESTGMDSLQTRLLSTGSIEKKKDVLERRALEILRPYLNQLGRGRLISLTQKPKRSLRATII